MVTKKSWNKKELKYFKSNIINKRAHLLIEMGELKENTKIANESSNSGDSTYSYHMADAGTDQGEREKAYYWLARENNYLQYLNRALEMLDDGSFGICQTCGELIGKERLEEVPHTSSCFACKTSGKVPN